MGPSTGRSRRITLSSNLRQHPPRAAWGCRGWRTDPTGLGNFSLKSFPAQTAVCRPTSHSADDSSEAAAGRIRSSSYCTCRIKRHKLYLFATSVSCLPRRRLHHSLWWEKSRLHRCWFLMPAHEHDAPCLPAVSFLISFVKEGIQPASVCPPVNYGPRMFGFPDD